MDYRAALLAVVTSVGLLGATARALDEASKAIPATTATTKPTATQASVTGAVPLFPDANPQVVTEVTRKIFPAVVRLDVATFKEQYGVTRKFAIPLLEYLDRERVTRRMGDARVLL